jgi:hypothetical protein
VFLYDETERGYFRIVGELTARNGEKKTFDDANKEFIKAGKACLDSRYRRSFYNLNHVVDYFAGNIHLGSFLQSFPSWLRIDLADKRARLSF